MSSELKIGFLGFGEAGRYIARGLRAAGVERICAYDLHAHTAARRISKKTNSGRT